MLFTKISVRLQKYTSDYINLSAYFMNILKCLVVLSFIISGSCFITKANDGGFYVDGNQLIPMVETNISVKKEILSINRSIKDPNRAEIIVYYEFFNPGQEKSMTVGFEAASPEGDANIEPVDGKHPYLFDFTVEMNSQFLPYDVAIVEDSLYYKNGIFKTLTKKQIDASIEDYANFRYVYHFDAVFKKGLNIIKHTYSCNFSTFVGSNYEFGYILSAAMRWGNHQIDDFTLNIDMGENQMVHITPAFFDNTSEWIIAGIGNAKMSSDRWSKNPIAEFFIKKGTLVFQKKNFKPKGELQFNSPRVMFMFDIENFNYRKDRNLPYDKHLYFRSELTASDNISKKILRNLPFAYRGYIFSTPELHEYYKNQIWYIPDSNYKPEIDQLPKEEKEWVQKWSVN